MRVVLDRAKCTGVGLCEAEAPDLFEVQEDGTLVQLEERPPPGRRAAAEAAAAGCPYEALKIVDD
jgi:ferredoxin